MLIKKGSYIYLKYSLWIKKKQLSKFSNKDWFLMFLTKDGKLLLILAVMK
jgi:hypothetical protein